MTRACMRPERAGFWCMLGGPGSRRQPHLAGRRRRRSSRPSSTAGPLSRRRRPAMVGGRVSAGSKRVRKHNRERGPCLLTASPSDGPGVRRFSPPAIALRRRGKSLPCFLVETGQGGISPMCNPLLVAVNFHCASCLFGAAMSTLLSRPTHHFPLLFVSHLLYVRFARFCPSVV